MPGEGPSCTTSQFDAVIVGGGHNGLVAAFYLARAGLSVAVLEAQSVVGGACRTEELIRGFRFSTCANWVGWWRPKVLEDMKLLERGLKVGGADVHSHVLEGNQGLVWWPESDRLVAELSRFSVADARRWGEWTAFWAQARDFFGPHLLSYPPGLGELFEHARAVGCEDFLTTLLTTSLAELTDRFFESEELRASVGAPVVLPHDVGSLYDHGSSLVAGVTAAALEYSETGMRAPYGFVKGGMGRITAEMARCAEEQGATIRTNCEVQEILTYANRVYGVRLANGEEIGAEVVVANTDVHRTFLKLLPRDSLEPRFVRRIQSLRTDVAPLKLHCAMNRLPEFAAFPGSDVPYRGPVTLRPTREHHERAWEAARRGELPAQPFMVGMTPSVWDDSLAPPGKHTLSFWILYAPERPVVGTWHAKREEMAELLIKFVVRHAPEFEDALDEYVLFTPADIEERMLLSHGNMHHVDISPSQLLAQRPCPELARYKTPVDRLYLCGAGQHPYGEVSGGPGHNAAHVVLEQLGRIPPATWQQSYQANDRGAAVAA